MSKTRRILLILLGLALLSRPVELLLAAMLPDASVNPVPSCVAGMAVSLLLLGVPAWLLRPWMSQRLPRKKSLWPDLLAALAAALLTRAAVTPLDAAWQTWLGLSPDALPLPETLPVAMLYVAALVAVPAVMEEIFFRGALLTSLLDGSRRWTAILLTAAAFALMHGSLANLPSLLVLSLLLTLLMLHAGHVAVPVTAHLVYNLTALGWTEIPLWGSLLCGAGLIALAVKLCFRQPRYAHLPMKGQDGLIAGAALVVLAILNLI